jgi:GT2 family glycosyltransferase
MTNVAVVIVHYRTPELVRPAVLALLDDARDAGLEIDLRLVDNGSDERDRAEWERLPLRLVGTSGNLGYAGGVNAGVAATVAPLVVAMNTDVEVRPGCLSRLIGSLQEGADVAGPIFEWDAGGRLLLPPTERRRFADELWAVAAERWPALAPPARRRWRAHARRHWTATSEIESTSLSGALLAFRRESWERLGPFDEGYRLYFEETDWLLRLRRAGGRARFVPGARAVHWYAQSSFREPAAARWFGEAERRFRRRQYGAIAAALLGGLASSSRGVAAATPGPSAPPSGEPPRIGADALGVRSRESWVEVSPLARGFPAATERLPEGASAWALPADLWRRAGTPPLFVRGIDAAGRESAATRYGEAGADLVAERDR